jgi:hypothetical protein
LTVVICLYISILNLDSTRLAAASDKVYQLLAHGRWFSPGTPASITTEIGRHDLAEILLKVALNTKNQIIIRYDHSQKIENPFNLNIFGAGTLKGLNREGLCVTDASFSYLVSLKHELVDLLLMLFIRHYI